MSSDAAVALAYAKAVHVYTRARERYRQFSRKTRPPEVAEAYAQATRALEALDIATGRRGACESPHLQNDLAVCEGCKAQCYRPTYLRGSGN